MALSVSLTGDWLQNAGSVMQSFGTITFDDSYATGGESLTPAMVGLGEIIGLSFIQGEDGYVAKWDKTNQKVLLYRSAGFTPAGTVAAPVFTGNALGTHTHDLKVIGGQGAAGTDTVTAPAGTDILGKQEATDADILGADSATKGGVVAISAGTPAGTNSAPAFTGTAVAAAALVEVGSGVDVSAVVINFIATGR